MFQIICYDYWICYYPIYVTLISLMKRILNFLVHLHQNEITEKSTRRIFSPQNFNWHFGKVNLNTVTRRPCGSVAQQLILDRWSCL